jgi:hypothetical protein
VRASAEAAAAKVKAGAGGGGGRGRDRDDEGDSRKRRAGAPKKKSLAPILGSLVVLLVVLGGAGWYFLVKRPADQEAASTAAAAADQARRAALLGGGQGSGVAAAEKSEPTAEETAAAEKAAADAAAAKEAAAASKEAKPAASKPAAKEVIDDIDLRELPELGKYSKSSDEEWANVVELAATFVDLDAGARSSRAGRELEEIGRAAFPALLNQFRILNLSDPTDFRKGDLIQRSLEKICKGRNYGWNYDGDVAGVVYNKKAIKAWFAAWAKAGEDDEQWAGLTKQTVTPADPEEGAKKPEESGSLDDF